MFNPHHFNRLLATAGKLGMTWSDTARFLWSYYGSRLPSILSQAEKSSVLTISCEKKPLQLAIRTNGFDLDVVDEIFARRCYDAGLTDVKTVLDLGANIGLAAAFFSSLYPGCTVACVEPVPSNIELLRRNVELNRLPVRLFSAAVGPVDGRIEMEISSDPRSSAALPSTYPPTTTSAETVSVEILSVPSLLSALGWSRVDLLKIDIEGGEKEVLGGRPEWLYRVGAVLGEGHLGNGYTIESARADLVPLGFRVALLEQRKGSFLFVASRRGG